jgi:hypothetical protein
VNWGLISSFALVTAGAGVVGVALSQLARGRAKPRAFASDLLIGAGAALAGAGPKVFVGAGMPVMIAALALGMSGLFLHQRERLRQERERELEKKDSGPQLR